MRLPLSVVIAFGSNLGPRLYHLHRAVHEVGKVVDLVCVSAPMETDAVDAPAGSPPFLNLVATGCSSLTPSELMGRLLEVERRLGRVRGLRNAPRTIDIDLILCSAWRVRGKDVTLPHPRAHRRAFVMAPLQTCSPALAAAVTRAVTA